MLFLYLEAVNISIVETLLLESKYLHGVLICIKVLTCNMIVYFDHTWAYEKWPVGFLCEKPENLKTKSSIRKSIISVKPKSLISSPPCMILISVFAKSEQYVWLALRFACTLWTILSKCTHSINEILSFHCKHKPFNWMQAFASIWCDHN